MGREKRMGRSLHPTRTSDYPAKLRSASPTPTIAAEREAWRSGDLAAGAMF